MTKANKISHIVIGYIIIVMACIVLLIATNSCVAQYGVTTDPDCCCGNQRILQIEKP
jgi:hypothetical protein